MQVQSPARMGWGADPGRPAGAVRRPQLQRAILKQLAQQPSAVVCDLAQVEAVDPLCAGCSPPSGIRPGPAEHDPGAVRPRPPVADLLLRHGLARQVGIHPSLEAALADARARPPRLSERCCWPGADRGPGWPEPREGGMAAGDLSSWPSRPRWWPASRSPTPWPMPARSWSCGWSAPILAAGGGGGPKPEPVGVLAAKDGAEHGLGLLVVDRVATAWGVRREGPEARWSGACWPCPRLPGWRRRPPRPRGSGRGSGWPRQRSPATRRRPAMLAPVAARRPGRPR
jgi:hypothetical protein